MDIHKKDKDFDPYSKCCKLSKKEVKMMSHRELVSTIEEYKKYKVSDKNRNISIKLIEKEFKKREELEMEIKGTRNC